MPGITIIDRPWVPPPVNILINLPPLIALGTFGIMFRSPSQILADNMVADHIFRPDDTAAHHIVAYSDPRAEGLRKLLESLGIGINDSVNGVFLPDRPGSQAPGAYHRSLYNDEYYRALRNSFDGVSTREEAITVLNDVRDRLLAAAYPGSRPVPPK